jgi:ribosome-binding factor A
VLGLYLVGGFRGVLPGFVSLTRVRVSPDLKIASLNYTMIMVQDEGEAMDAFERRQGLARKEATKELNAHARDVQAELAHKLQLRFTPKVTFYYDDGFENALKVEKILRDMSVSAGRGDELPGTTFTEPKQGSDPASDMRSITGDENGAKTGPGSGGGSGRGSGSDFGNT